jgi:negative regulator of flagellin synthesis FlgM
MRVSQTSGNTQAQATETHSTEQAQHASKSKNTKRGALAQENSPAHASVNTEISTRAKEFGRAKSIAMNTPDVREEKIAALKKRIAEGRYQVDSAALADRIVEEHLDTAEMG